VATSLDRNPPLKVGIWIVVAIALTATIRYLFDPILADTYPYILFVFPALWIANRAGLRPALVTLLLGLATANFLFATPRMSLWVSAPQNQLGLLFYLAVGGAGEAAENAREPQRIRGGNESILLVEDQADVRKIALMGLESHGYAVLAASDGLGALASIEDRPHLDILVTDVVMPGMSGRELAEKVRTLYPGIKVLYMSGYTEDAVIRHGILQEDVAFIRKPFTPNTLAIKVRQVLDGVLVQ